MRGKVGIAPMVHGLGQQSHACQGGWGWGIAQTAAHVEAAQTAIAYFSSPDVHRQLTLQSGYLPTRRSLYRDPEIQAKYPHFAQMEKILATATLRPAIAQYDQASDILQRYLSAALAGQLTPTRAMKQAAQETRQLLGRTNPLGLIHN